MAKQPTSDVSIGKFDILATYTLAHALLAGHDEDEAKQRGMVAAVMGAQARLGIRKEHDEVRRGSRPWDSSPPDLESESAVKRRRHCPGITPPRK